MSEMMPGMQSVNVAYNADVTGYTQSLGEAIASTDQYSKVADGAAGSVAKFGIAMTRMSGSVMGANKSMMSPAIQQAAAYEQQLSSLQARTVTAGQSFGKMGEQIRAMARDMPIGMSGAVQQFEALSRVGVTTQQNIGGVAKAVTQLGAATGELGPNLTQQMVQFQRTMGQMDAGAFSKMGDAIAGVTSQMGASAQGTLALANQIGPLAEMVGTTSTQIAGFSAAFDRVGVDGARGANIFSKIVTDMDKSVRDGTPGMEIYAQAVGKTTTQFAELFKTNPTEALTKVMEALGGSGRQSLRTLEQLGFGVRDQRTIAQIAAGGGMREAVASAQANYGNGSAARGAEEAFSGLNDTVKKANESLSQMVEASGRPLIGAFTGLAGVSAGVADKFAGLMSSPIFQTLATTALVAKGAVGAAGIAGSGVIAAGQYGALAAMVPRGVMSGPLGLIRNNSRGLMLGGAGAMAAGMAMDNPTVGLLGTAALLAGTSSTGLQGARNLAGRGVSFMYGSAFDSTNERWLGRAGNAAGVAAETGQMRSIYKRMGLDPDDINDKDFKRSVGLSRRVRSDMQSAEQSYTKSMKDLDKQALSKAEFDKEQLRLRKEFEAKSTAAYGKTANAYDVRTQGIRGIGNAREMITGGASALGSAIFSPAGLAIAGVGAAAYGGYQIYQANQANAEQAANTADNPTRIFSERMGVALKAVDPWSSALGDSVGEVKDFADALSVTAGEMQAMKASGKKFDIAGNLNSDQLFDWVLATAGGQSKEYMSAMLENIAVQRDRGTANEIGARLAEQGGMGNSRMMSDAFFRLAPGDTKIGNSTDVGNFLSNVFTSGYGGDQQAWQNARSLGENQSAIATDVAASQGQAAGATQRKKDVEGFLRAYAEKYPTDGDPQIIREYLKAQGYNDTRSQDIADRTNQALIQADIDKNGSFGTLPTERPGDINYVVSDALTEQNDIINAFADKQDGFIKKWTDSADMIDKKSGAVLKWAQSKGLTTEELVSATQSKDGMVEKNGQQFQIPGRLRNQATLLQVQAATMASEKSGMLAGMARVYSGAPGTSPLATIQRVQQQLASGKVQQGSDEYNSLMGQLQAAQMALPQQMGGMSNMGGALATVSSTAAGARRIMSGNVKAGDTSYEADMAAFQQNTQALEQVRKFATQKLEMERNYQIQTVRAEEDFYQQRAWANEDYYQQRAWSVEDYQLQVKRQTADFYRQQGIDEDNFYRNRQRAADDFARQRRYQAEDMTASVVNPYELPDMGSVASAPMILDNISQQLSHLKQQQSIVDDLKSRGLAQETIDGLRLADPSNMWQALEAQYWTTGEIRSLNRKYKKISKFSEAYGSDVDNVQGRRQKEGYQIGRGRELSDFERGQRQQENFFQRSLRRSDKDFEKSLDRQATMFAKQMERNREQFTKSMVRAREDVDNAMEQIVLSTDQGLGIVTGKIKSSGNAWERYTQNNMAGVTGKTKDGWKDATGVHKSALDWVYEAYKALAIDGKSTSQWSGGAPTAHTSGGSTSGGTRSETNEHPNRSSASSVSATSLPMRSNRSSDTNDVSAASATTPSGVTLPGWGSNGAPSLGSYPTTVTKPGQGNFNKLLESMKDGTAGLKGYSPFGMGKPNMKGFKQALQGGFGNIDPNTRRMGAFLKGMFPEFDTIGGYRPSDPYPDHPSGESLDFMIPGNMLSGNGFANKQGIEYGDQMVDFIIKNADKIGVKLLIWQGKDWSPGNGWSSYGGYDDVATNPTTGHYDHVHARFEPNIPGGGGSLGYASKKEQAKARKKAMGKWDKSLWSLINANPGSKLGGGGGSYGGGKGWRWPMRQPNLSADNFGEQRPGHIHAGEDMSAGAGGKGVYAVYMGDVTQAQNDGGIGYGNNVIIKHPNGFLSQYGHLARYNVHVGEKVRTGQRIGTMGDSGSPGSYHLHFNLTKGGDPNDYAGNINPTDFLRKHAKGFAYGGVVTDPTYALIGEAGDREAVIPLNGRGVEVIAEAIGRYAHSFEAKAARTAGRGIDVGATTYVSDNSTQFNGPITVRADDTAKMAHQLRAEARRRRLVSPQGGRR